MQFSEMTHPVRAFELLFSAALESLLRDLSDKPWYIRERQVVNLFVFDHLIPQFQYREPPLDIGQIAVEIPVWIEPHLPGEKPGIPADIVIWPHNKATNWNSCRPLARVEWKHISCRCRTAARIKAQETDHHYDVERLCRTSNWACVNFAILTKRNGGKMSLSCKKIIGEQLPSAPHFMDASVPASGDERPYLGKISDIAKRDIACVNCTPTHTKL